MDIILEETLHIGQGRASLADAFQCGREAAQMAKSQLPDGPLDLVLVLAPATIHFQDFIEGVRLVTGEETLIGLPTSNVITADLLISEPCHVLIFQTPGMRVSLASTELNPENLVGSATSLLTQFRASRGNTRHQFENYGLLLFDNEPQATDRLARLTLADAGGECSLLAVSPKADERVPLICRNKSLNKGVVGVEFLSNSRWGLGTVTVSAFKNQPNIYMEAVQSSLREARAQLKDQSPAMGLLWFNFASNEVIKKELQNVFIKSQPGFKNIPFVGIFTNQNVVRCPPNAPVSNNDSVVSLLVPQ
jgi:hypothetical protein